MLIAVPEHSSADLDHWRRLARYDAMLADSGEMRRRETRSLEIIERVLRDPRPMSLGVSWGKDSVCVAHLLALAQERVGRTIPVFWVVARPVVNPHCCAVRDAFLARWPLDYHEILDDRRHDPGAEGARWTGWAGDWRAGFREAVRRFGPRHMSGVRADENSTRRMVMRRYGEVSASTARPIGWWSGVDIFAYLKRHDLPVHPSYAMTFGGTLERERIRVDALGGNSGVGFGRRIHEERYYRAATGALVHRLRRAEDCPWWNPYDNANVENTSK